MVTAVVGDGEVEVSRLTGFEIILVRAASGAALKFFFAARDCFVTNLPKVFVEVVI